jgi:UDP-glucose 4-epimerase
VISNRSRRILITGVSSHTGGRLAQLLEGHQDVEAIVGVDTRDPQHELQRTEFVRVDPQHARFRRILRAAAIDTVLDTRLIVDPLTTSLKQAHEVNATGTVSMLSACDGADSTVRKLVFKSSAQYYGCDPGDPAFLSEEMARRRPPTTAIERDIVAAEEAVATFASRNPTTTVTVMRCADEIGAEAQSPYLSLLALPVVPSLLGFDPRCQFIHEEDVIGALAHAVGNGIPGIYNAAADGILALSEVASLLGKPLLPLLPPWGTVLAARRLRALGLRIPVELLRELRFGRGLDNRRLKATGFAYRYTTREALLKLRAQQRLRPLLSRGGDPYRYEREIEEFLRWSPSVHSASFAGALSGGTHEPPRRGSYDELSAAELIEIISSLEPEAVIRLRDYEAAHMARAAVLNALDSRLAGAQGWQARR